jgi:sirohydrochlorin cobaltochelatase
VFAKDALLLIGHGSARYPDAGRIIGDQVRRISAAGVFREVAMGLLNGTPSAGEALARLAAPVVRVVPCFMEDGYFTRVAVPRALGLKDGASRVVLCPPVGVHEGMASLIELRVRGASLERGIDPAATAVVVIGHGSARAPGRALALHRHVDTVVARGGFATVVAACLEEAPFVADVLRSLRSYTVAVVGFFAGEGVHVRDDVPALIAAERAERGPAGPDIHNLGCVTDTPAMPRVILEQAGSAEKPAA